MRGKSNSLFSLYTDEDWWEKSRDGSGSNNESIKKINLSAVYLVCRIQPLRNWGKTDRNISNNKNVRSMSRKGLLPLLTATNERGRVRNVLVSTRSWRTLSVFVSTCMRVCVCAHLQISNRANCFVPTRGWTIAKGQSLSEAIGYRSSSTFNGRCSNAGLIDFYLSNTNSATLWDALVFFRGMLIKKCAKREDQFASDNSKRYKQKMLMKDLNRNPRAQERRQCCMQRSAFYN